MPTADQLKALLASHGEGDEAQFFAVAMEIAATEARAGHGKLAEELRGLIDKSKNRASFDRKIPIPLARPRGELADFLTASYPNIKLPDMVLGAALEKCRARDPGAQGRPQHPRARAIAATQAYAAIRN